MQKAGVDVEGSAVTTEGTTTPSEAGALAGDTTFLCSFIPLRVFFELMSHPMTHTAIIIELNDVLFRGSSQLNTSIPPHKLSTITHSSNAWFKFEKGYLTEEECHARVATEYKLNPIELRQAFDQARSSLCADNELFVLLRELKTASNGLLRIFAMTNISIPDYDALRSKPADWSIFDQIFTSCTVGVRKPNLNFYRRVLATTNLDPMKVIFIDNEFENIFAARSLGMRGFVFENPAAVERSLRNLLGNPVARGQAFLRHNAKHHDCITRQTGRYDSTVVDENWTQLLILEATNDKTLVDFVEYPRKWNFFKGRPQLTTDYYPDDLDTTAVGLTVLKVNKEIAHPILDEMLNYVNTDGIFLGYFDHERERVDAGMCINVLTLFYSYGRGSEVEPTLRWIRDILEYRAYLEGTRYFETPECFLWLVSRLLSYSGDTALHTMLKPLLKERVQERIGSAGDALAIAMRILVCHFVGITNEVDLGKLLPLQCVDGGWEIGWIYHFPTAGVTVGNRGLTTALAIKAIEGCVGEGN